MHTLSLITAISLALILIPTCAAAAEDSPSIQIHPGNSKYFLFRNKPTFLLTATEHYGSVLNRPFDFRKYLDDLVDKKMTMTRTFLLFRELASDKNPASPCKPKPEDYIAPWPRTGTAKALDGQSQFDLSQWNAEYFDRLHAFLDYASARGIVVELTLLSNTYGPEVWALNPLRAENNVQQIGKIDWREYMSLKDKAVVEKQLAHVRKIVQETAKYDNVYYEICNEPGGGFAGHTTPAEVDQWQAEIAKTIREEMTKAKSRHLIFASEAFNYTPIFTQGLDASFANPAYDAVNIHPLPNTILGHKPYQLGNFMSKEMQLPDFCDFAQVAYAQKKPCVFDEDNCASMFQDDQGWTIHRKRAWVALLNGSHYDEIDFSIQIGKETGTPESTAKLRNPFKFLSEFVQSIDFIHAKPTNWIDKIPAHASAAQLAVENKDYIAYIADNREVTDPAAGSEIAATIEIALPPGEYTTRFFTPATGEYSQSQPQRGGASALRLPSFTNDLVVRVTQTK